VKTFIRLGDRKHQKKVNWDSSDKAKLEKYNIGADQ